MQQVFFHPFHPKNIELLRRILNSSKENAGFSLFLKLILFNPVIRDFLGQQDVASLKQSEKLRTHFLEKLEELLKKEKL